MKIITLGNKDYKVESISTLNTYTVYALRVDRHNKIKEYLIKNLGRYEWWGSNHFRDVKKKKFKRVCSCCCQCIICGDDDDE